MLPLKLRVIILLISLIILIITIRVQRKHKISVRYTIVWYFTSLMLIALSCFTNLFEYVSSFVGFEITSNFLIAVFITIFIIMSFCFTVMISNLKQKTIDLVQEVSILKKEVEELKK